MKNTNVRKAVIPAAGYGTRFLPATKVIAKETFPIIDTPTIELIVREALESGITEFLIIVSSNKNSIVDYFDRNLELEHVLKEKGRMDEYRLITELPNKVNIHFLRQKEMAEREMKALYMGSTPRFPDFVALPHNDNKTNKKYVLEAEQKKEGLGETTKKTNRKEPAGKLQNNIFRFLNMPELLKSPDALLIMGLIFLLMSDNADEKLILALVFIML
jgi:hypothetical protein